MDRPMGPRPPLSTSPTSISSAPTLVGTPIEYHPENKLRKHTPPPVRRDREDVESFLRGGRSPTGQSDEAEQVHFVLDSPPGSPASHIGEEEKEGGHDSGSITRSYITPRRKWTKFCLAVLEILFMASCGGCVLSGFLFAGIGEVKGLTGQWISQGLVAFGSLTSLFYITMHIRASRLGNNLYATSTSTVGFEHPLELQAVLTIRAAFLLWLSALPAISMGIFHGGRTILKLDLFISICGFLCTSFLVFILERTECAFELPLFSPTPSHGDLTGLLGADLEAAALRGGGKTNPKDQKRTKGKGSGASFSNGSSASSFTFTASSSSSGTGSGASSPTRTGGGRRIITVPAPSYGPRAHPGKSTDRRVLTRLSVINAMVPPAHHAPSPPTPPQQGQAAGASPGSPSRARSALSTASTVASAAATKLTPIAAGVASTVSGWIWGGGNKTAAPSGAGSGPQPAQQQQSQQQQPRAQGHAVRHGDDGGMPGGYYAGQGGGHGW
ncbi:hypothetical protein V8F33_005996 [Rhypophila sp. PSN 637]